MKSKFKTTLSGTWLDDDKSYRLDSDLIYYSELLDYEVIMPKGSITDFASVPRVPIIYWFFGGRAHHESAIHDYLYSTGKVNKVLADKVFLEAMECRKKNRFIRYPMYWGVRIGGSKAWKDHRKNDKNGK